MDDAIFSQMVCGYHISYVPKVILDFEIIFQIINLNGVKQVTALFINPGCIEFAGCFAIRENYTLNKMISQKLLQRIRTNRHTSV